MTRRDAGCETGLPTGGVTDRTFGLWPPHFPHVELDALFERLDSETLSREELERLLVLVGREARRLRTTVTRLTAARLMAAQEEAGNILAAARQRAEELTAATSDAAAPAEQDAR